MRRVFSCLILLIALAAGMYIQRVEILEWYRSFTRPALPEAVEYEEIIMEEEEPSAKEIPSDLEVPEATAASVQRALPDQNLEEEILSDIPVSLNLAVPFTPQAPHANWDLPYKEACEEASVYMVHAYYEGVSDGLISADQAELDILNIIAFENELFGYFEDTTAEQTGIFAELMFGHTYQLIENPTVDEIKQELIQGRPVIVPAAGRLLGNPYFTAPGPLYHMLVIRGYTEDNQFIVNDPGTYRGEAYLYDFDTILYAMHDWNNGGEITEGRKVVIVLNP